MTGADMAAAQAGTTTGGTHAALPVLIIGSGTWEANNGARRPLAAPISPMQQEALALRSHKA
jgi:hypothetical protein